MTLIEKKSPLPSTPDITEACSVDGEWDQVCVCVCEVSVCENWFDMKHCNVLEAHVCTSICTFNIYIDS